MMKLKIEDVINKTNKTEEFLNHLYEEAEFIESEEVSNESST